MRRPLAAALAGCLLAALAGCSGAERPADPVTVVDAAAIRPVPLDEPAPAQPGPDVPAWAVDPSAVQLSGDSLAEIRDVPGMLVDRRLPTAPHLPPPAEDRFASTVGPIPRPVQLRMGRSWSAGCPVALSDLRYVTVVFRGFDGRAHTGELVVHASVTATVVEAFRALYEADFPIEEMRLITTADHLAPATGDGNNTAGYNCRKAVGQRRWSAHAFGTSVDINPFQNPLVRRGTVVPELGAAYADRARVRPGMITPDNPAVRVFREAGWVWGGDWTYSKDYMHFSTDGS